MKSVQKQTRLPGEIDVEHRGMVGNSGRESYSLEHEASQFTASSECRGCGGLGED